MDDALPNAKSRGRWWIVLPILILAFLGWVVFQVLALDRPLPEVHDIASMRAGLAPHRSGNAIVGAVDEFDVPAHRRRAILEAMMPARRNFAPAKCQGVGWLRIAKPDGRELHVGIYTSGYSVNGAEYLYPDRDQSIAAVREAILKARDETSPAK